MECREMVELAVAGGVSIPFVLVGAWMLFRSLVSVAWRQEYNRRMVDTAWDIFGDSPLKAVVRDSIEEHISKHRNIHYKGGK